MESYKIPTCQGKLEQEEQNQSITIPHFKLYYNTIIIKTLWLSQKQTRRLVGQNRALKSIYTYMINRFITRSQEYTIYKNIQWGKEHLFNNGYCEEWTALCKQNKTKLNHCLTLHMETNSKWIKDLNIRPETKLLGCDLLDTGLGNVFFWV